MQGRIGDLVQDEFTSDFIPVVFGQIGGTMGGARLSKEMPS